ncbi:hypothetical protein GGR20_001450 [Devosia subaequoris]|uniref:Uncharacterized protein n=1 Tax=Devosia subaequoris TaxID=395930 RepID=A0A7W6NBC4_9HYPH|nr:hypothetical protein [Devosia subaequoris]
MILSSVSRCGVRREEEIGARLSDGCYMNSTDLIDNPETDMSAMRFCEGWLCVRKKERPRSRGEQGPKEDRSGTCQEGTQRAQGREEKHPL